MKAKLPSFVSAQHAVLSQLGRQHQTVDRPNAGRITLAKQPSEFFRAGFIHRHKTADEVPADYALATAGAMTGTGGSPQPLGASVPGTMCTSTATGASFISRDVLAHQPQRLLALRDHSSGWADFGSPERVLATLARNGIQPEWVAAEDWVDELELMDALPGPTRRAWGAVTIAASAQLARRLNTDVDRPTPRVASTDTKVSPIPSSNCFGPTGLA